MKHFISTLLCLIILFQSFQLFAINTSAVNEEPAEYKTESILITGTGDTLTASYKVQNGLSEELFLFRVTPDNESISGLTPISSVIPTNGEAVFNLEFENTDHSLSVCGYVLARKSGSRYTALTDTGYIDNFGNYAHNRSDYPNVLSKKGLEVQYITDAQISGVAHTVVHVNIDDLLTTEKDNNFAYIYGNETYYIDSNALNILDYRIKTLTDAGIHIYINYILSFDSSAPSDLYYPNAEGTSSTLFAPNVSSPDCINRIASLTHFLTERYTSGEYGFCGSYIIGYEVNNQADNNSAGIQSLAEYAEEYSVLLRTIYLTSVSAYKNSRIYISLSNEWNIPSENQKKYHFSSKEFLDAIVTTCPDIPFGIAINPYPSTLTMGAYWNDDKASSSLDTEYITMKNIDILTTYLKNDSMKYKSNVRPVVISEFGISGIKDTESEKIQAAAYAYAYMTALNNNGIEAFIWHRHVDHISELNLSYGLFTSTELTLEAKEKKLIHKIFSLIDTDIENYKKELNGLIKYLPFKNTEELLTGINDIRDLVNTNPSSLNSSDSYKSHILFDFSKSLYSFFPTDNAEYLETIQEKGSSFMRVATIKLSPYEYMGCGINLENISDIKKSDYITVKFRINSEYSNADFMMLISGNNGDKIKNVSFLSPSSTNKWLTATFKTSDLKDINDNCTLKLWVRSDNSKNEQIFLDIASITLYTEKNQTALIILIAVITVGMLFFGCVFIFITVDKRKKPEIRNR